MVRSRKNLSASKWMGRCVRRDARGQSEPHGGLVIEACRGCIAQVIVSTWYVTVGT